MHVVGREHALLVEALSEQPTGIEQCKSKGLGSHAESTISMDEELKRWLVATQMSHKIKRKNAICLEKFGLLLALPKFT